MTKLLQQAIEEASQLPEEEQDSFAEWLLAELRSDRKWAEAFSNSSEKLAQLAQEALREHSEGLTTDLDPDRL